VTRFGHLLILTGCLELSVFATAASADQPVLGISQQSNTVVLTWLVTTQTFDLEYTTNLASTNWNFLTNSSIVGGQYLVVDNISNANRFYRLSTPPCITVPPVFQGVTVGEVTYTHSSYINISAPLGTPFTLDSSFTDPSTCENGPLSYQWTVTTGGNPYTGSGISGYTTSSLNIGTALSDGQQHIITLTATGVSGLSTQETFTLTIYLL